MKKGSSNDKAKDILERMAVFHSKTMVEESKEKSYCIMNKNMVVALFTNGKVKVIDKALCPYFLVRGGDFYTWLNNRSIDTHRRNSRLLRKALRISSEEESDIVLSVNAVSVTDTYWVKEIGSDLSYDDVRFKHDYFHDISLNGNLDVHYANQLDDEELYNRMLKNPQLTLVGSYEKCWRLINDKWCMIKTGKSVELYSELLAYRLCQYFGFPTAKYEISEDKKSIISENFVPNGYSLEDMFSYINDEEDYAQNISFLNLFSIDKSFVKQYLDIIFMDAIIRNPDRHTHNYGIIRDNRGRFVSMAPNFDNNLSLIGSSGLVTNNPSTDMLMVDFIGVAFENGFRVPQYASLEIQKLCIDVAEGLVPHEIAYKCSEFILNRVRFIEDALI